MQNITGTKPGISEAIRTNPVQGLKYGSGSVPKSTLALYISRAHNSASRMIGFTLTLGDEAGWWEFSALLMMRLSRRERVALAYAALNALNFDDAYVVADTSLYGHARGPGYE